MLCLVLFVFVGVVNPVAGVVVELILGLEVERVWSGVGWSGCERVGVWGMDFLRGQSAEHRSNLGKPALLWGGERAIC